MIRGLSIHDQRLAVAIFVLMLLGSVDAAGLSLVVLIDWATLPGPEAGIVSSIITAVVTGTIGLGATIVGFYFGASPTETKPS